MERGVNHEWHAVSQQSAHQFGRNWTIIDKVDLEGDEVMVRVELQLEMWDGKVESIRIVESWKRREEYRLLPGFICVARL